MTLANSGQPDTVRTNDKVAPAGDTSTHYSAPILDRKSNTSVEDMKKTSLKSADRTLETHFGPAPTFFADEGVSGSTGKKQDSNLLALGETRSFSPDSHEGNSQGADEGKKGKPDAKHDKSEGKKGKPGEKSKPSEENDGDEDLKALFKEPKGDDTKGGASSGSEKSKEKEPERELKGNEKSNKDKEVFDVLEDSKEKRQEDLKSKRKDPDLGKLLSKETPILLIGESHTDTAGREFLAKQAGTLKEQGVTHFGIEAIPAKMQPVLDRYFNGDEKAREEIKSHLDLWNKAYPDAHAGDGYMKILDAMRDKGIKPVGLDTEDHGLTARNRVETDEHGRQFETPEKLLGKGMTERNKLWADTMAKILKDNPNARIVALGGRDHFSEAHTPSAETFLKEQGVNANLLHTTGGDLPAHIDSKRESSVVSATAQQLGIENQAFIVPVDRKYAMTDYFLHVPQTKKP